MEGREGEERGGKGKEGTGREGEREGSGVEGRARKREEGKEGKVPPNNFSHPQFRFSRNMPDHAVDASTA